MEAIHERKTIQEHRVAAGLTQEKLAEQIGVHRVSLARYESGDAEPTARTLLAIAAALNVNPGAIVLSEKRHAS